jgi:polar amino acid transport system ATP-binding protein
MSDIIHMEHVCKTFGELSLLEDLTLEEPDSGRIEIDGDVMWQKKSNGRGVDVNHLRLVRAKLGMVFQQFNLFPHMTAQANAMVAPIHVLGMGRTAAEQRIWR